MTILVDMNLSPLWVDFLKAHGVEAVHGSTIGDPRAPDTVIMAWARERGWVVFTHDLDFSALLATTSATGPSVLQVRGQDVLPGALGEDVARVLREHSDAIERGAIVTLDLLKSRIRILPIGRTASGGGAPG